MQPRITICSVCHSQMSPGQQVCKNCGTMLCTHCREPLPPKSRYCPSCGFLCATEQYGSTAQFQPTTPTLPQAAAIPGAQASPPQPVQQAAMQRQPTGIPAIESQHSCPRCGASIDPEMSRCTGCGLLYRGKPRIVQQSASATPAARPPLVSGTQYNNPEYSHPSSGLGQRPSYISHGGMQSPMPSVAPAAASPASMPASPPLPAGTYPYQAVPPVPGGGVSGAGKRGLMRIITTLFIIIVCCFIGGGIYYFVNQDVQPAIAIYVELLEKNPEDREVLLALGQICMQQARRDDAAVFYQRVLELEPTNSDAQMGLTALAGR